MQYRTDGTLQWVRQAGLTTHQTNLGVFHRGIPQSITYPDSSATSAQVNDHGQITAVTTERGYTTNYDYRGDGRLYQIRHPLGDTQAWNTTSIALQPAGAEYGVAAGHWTQTVTTGTGTKRTVLDALWQPRVTVVEPGDGTQRITVRNFDHAGREIFASHPKASGTISTITAGLSTGYDALGRQTWTSLDSELGALNTATHYVTGFKTEFWNARNYKTTTEYMAFDEPTEQWPTKISEPLSTTTVIARNEFALPVSMQRYGPYGGTTISSMRSYVYDSNKRLCKTIDPETYATIVGYDAAGNVEWRASGQDFSGYGLTNQCHQANVPAAQKTSYVYDTRNRLKDTTFGDGSSPINTTYHADGLPWTVASGGHTWTYGYNGRGLLTSELLSSGTSSFSIGHAYNANGHEASLTYPDGSSVDFAPNGLGEPTKSGSYATGVQRHVNGALKAFSYGNGVYHDSTQTLHRGLPDVITETKGGTTILADNYDWDENANVVAITSTAPGDLRSRTMAYDGRDRLTETYFSTLGGAPLAFTYDPLDNLRSYTTGYRPYLHEYDPATWRQTGIRNTDTQVLKFQYQYTGAAGKRGNVTARIRDTSPSSHFTYDLGNRVLQVTGTFNETYSYDGHRRRTTIQLGTGPKKYQIYSQGGQLLQVGATGAVGTEQYVYLGKHLVAKRITGAGGTTTVRYQHTDGVGSPTAETDATGTLITGSRQLHEPYGLVSVGTPTQGPGFTGHVYDAQTGIYYMQQRYYDQVAGRFLSVDPVVPEAATGANFNRYWYANNNPYKNVDPDGRQACGKDTTCRFENGEYGASSAHVYGAQGGRDEASEIAAEIHHDFIGKQNEVGQKVATGASEIADVVDEQATDTVKYWWLGPVGKFFWHRYKRCLC